MPVRRFGTLDEARAALPRRDPAASLSLFCAIANLAATTRVERRYPPGVRRYTSLEEAGRDRERWTEVSMRATAGARAADSCRR